MKMDKRYKYFRDGSNTVIAISTYAGKTVKGIAKARCDAKLSKKRYDNANSKLKAAYDALIAAGKYYNEMVNYKMDAFKAMEAEKENLANILNEAK